MSNIRQYYDEIINHLNKLQRPVLQYLNKGSAINDVDEIKLPEAYVELISICNGTNHNKDTILDDIHFFPGFYFMSFRESMSTYLVLHTDSRWSKYWFPVFSNGGGDFYALDCRSFCGNEVPIVGFILGETEQILEYNSLTAMFQTLLMCYEQKIFFLKDGFLESNDLKQSMLTKKLNSLYGTYSTA